VIEDSESAIKALQDYQTGKAGFADYFLARTHLAMGAKHTVSSVSTCGVEKWHPTMPLEQ